MTPGPTAVAGYGAGSATSISQIPTDADIRAFCSRLADAVLTDKTFTHLVGEGATDPAGARSLLAGLLRSARSRDWHKYVRSCLVDIKDVGAMVGQNVALSELAGMLALDADGKVTDALLSPGKRYRKIIGIQAFISVLQGLASRSHLLRPHQVDLLTVMAFVIEEHAEVFGVMHRHGARPGSKARRAMRRMMARESWDAMARTIHRWEPIWAAAETREAMEKVPRNSVAAAMHRGL